MRVPVLYYFDEIFPNYDSALKTHCPEFYCIQHTMLVFDANSIFVWFRQFPCFVDALSYYSFKKTCFILHFDLSVSHFFKYMIVLSETIMDDVIKIHALSYKLLVSIRMIFFKFQVINVLEVYLF